MGYVAAIALLIGGAGAGSMYLTQPKPAISQSERVTEPGKRMQDTSAALPKPQHLPPKHALRRRMARRRTARRE